MRMKQLTFFFGWGGGVTTNLKISHHYFLCVCCPTLWMPTFLAQLQEDLAACQRKVYPPHADANWDDQFHYVRGSQAIQTFTFYWHLEDTPKLDIWSRKWCVSEMMVCEQKNKVIVKRGSTFDLEGAHPSKKHLTWVSRSFFGIQDMSTQTRHKFQVKRGKGTSPNESTSSSSPSLKIWHRKSTLGSLSRL